MFTGKDIGCHAGSGFGRDHRREVLARLVATVGGDDVLTDALRAPVSGDEEHKAIALLQTHTAAGLAWKIKPGGDLFLTDDTD